MKSLARRTVALVAVLVFTLSLVGCGNSIVGTWKGSQDGVEMTFTFEKDGTGKTGVAGMTLDTTWKTDGNKLSITMSFLGQSDTQEFEYSVSGDTLKLTADGSTVEFKKQ